MEQPRKRRAVVDVVQFPVEIWAELLQHVICNMQIYYSLSLSCKHLRYLTLEYCNISKITLSLASGLCKYENMIALSYFIKNPTAGINLIILQECARRRQRDLLHWLLTSCPPNLHSNTLMEIACKNADTKLIRMLYRFPLISPSVKSSRPFRVACLQEDAELVELLLLDYRVDPDAKNNKALLKTTSLNILEILWKDSRVDFSVNTNEAFINACKRGDIDVVQWMLERSLTAPFYDKAQIELEARKPIQFPHVFRPPINPAAQGNKALISACENGYIDIVTLLLKHPSINPSENNNEALLKAITNNREEIVYILLGHVDPSIANNIALETACKMKNISKKILLRLLDDPRIDPNAIHVNFQQALINPLFVAVASLNIKVVDILMEHSRINCAIMGSHVIRVFSRCILENPCKLTEISNLFFKIASNRTIDLTIDNNYLFKTICGFPLVRLVEYLLYERNISPPPETLFNAVASEAHGIVDILLQDNRIDAIEKAKAFSRAIQNSDIPMLHLILPYVQLENSYLMEACSYGQEDVVLFLLERMDEPNIEDALYASRSPIVDRILQQRSKGIVYNDFPPKNPRNAGYKPEFTHINPESIYSFNQKNPTLEPEEKWHKKGQEIIYKGNKGTITELYMHKGIEMCEIFLYTSGVLDVPLDCLSPLNREKKKKQHSRIPSSIEEDSLEWILQLFNQDE